MFSDGQLTLLPLLPEREASEAWAINGSGQIVGGTSPTDAQPYDAPILWTPQ